MEPEIFRYIKVGHSESGLGYVLATFERQEGTQFTIALSADDAERLCGDLRSQINIARFDPK